ncbi:MAG: D-alanyl-D-alanine carboxypeptidase/D-alanyl-D-alanine-endopeptidase [Patescibacteria group bacterium]
MSTNIQRKNLLFFLGLCAISLALGLFVVMPLIRQRNFYKFLDRTAQSEKLKGATLALDAKYEGDKNSIISYNAKSLIHPGSNFKLFTAAASLAKLGPEYRFITQVISLPQSKDLLLLGGGDPSLKQKDLALLAESLKQYNTVWDDLYYDDRFFEGEKFGPGWDEKWRDEYFAVPITGLQINDNLLQIHGGKNVETEIFGIDTTPLEHYSPLISELSYYQNPNDMKTGITAVMDAAGRVTLKGDTMENLPFRTSAVMRDPSRMAALVLKQELIKNGLMKASAGVLHSQGTPMSKPLTVHTSAPLKDLVFEMLKFSKNNYAETLVRTLGKAVKDEGSQKMGVEVLNDFFREVGIPQDEIAAFDGSGLAPSTRASSHAIIMLFNYVDDQNWKDLFWNALPESQVDGTLKYRFENAGLKHTVIGKTGTHEFASSLSGKILRPGKNLLFSVHIFNHPFSTESSVLYIRPIIDRIIALLDQQF